MNSQTPWYLKKIVVIPMVIIYVLIDLYDWAIKRQLIDFNLPIILLTMSVMSCLYILFIIKKHEKDKPRNLAIMKKLSKQPIHLSSKTFWIIVITLGGLLSLFLIWLIVYVVILNKTI